MALNNDAVFLPERCFIFYAPIGSTIPTSVHVSGYDPDVAPDVLGAAGTNEVQTVTITGSPTGGTFTLTYSGQTTGTIAYNATAATVQTALRALSNIDESDVTVTGGPLPATAVTVTFIGDLASENVAQMTSSGSFTGGTSPAVAVTTSTAGVAGPLPEWKSLGHTDLDEDIKGDEEGGKSEVRGTRQVPNLRVRDEPVTDFFTITSVQFSADTLALYYGGGTETSGTFTSPISTRAQDLMVLLVYIDGDRKLGELHRKCSVKRDGPISREADNFLRAPIRFTPLDPGVASVGDTEWLSADLFG